jgi:uncharacterized membrane protein YfcA
MQSMELSGYIASFFVGLILGVLGSGGSLLSIPILVYLFSLDVVVASGYSLFIVGITSLVGALQRYATHKVDLRIAVTFGIPSIVSIFATRKWIVVAIPEIILKTPSFLLSRRVLILGLFAILVILASILMIAKKDNPKKPGQAINSGMLIFQGMLIGFLTGLVGVGGGFLIIPSLVFLTNIPFKTAVGTSLVIISIKSLFGFLGDLLNYPIDWPFLLTVSAIAIAGILAGNRYSMKVSGPFLKKSFGWFTLTLGIAILIKESLF